MATMTFDPATLYRVRRGVVDIVDVPELGYFAVDGAGAPEDGEFAAALQALYGVSYAAHFLLRKERGEATHVGPLEALWWVDDPEQQALVEAVAAGTVSPDEMNRRGWRWRAMICQPSTVDADIAERAIAQVRAKRPGVALERVGFIRWAEGRCAQVLHIGPYSEETPTIVRLHDAIAAAGWRPRGRHHEIYLSDPRRTAPDRLRTILRQPIDGQLLTAK
jgi:hypothetical protein